MQIKERNGYRLELWDGRGREGAPSGFSSYCVACVLVAATTLWALVALVNPFFAPSGGDAGGVIGIWLVVAVFCTFWILGVLTAQHASLVLDIGADRLRVERWFPHRTDLYEVSLAHVDAFALRRLTGDEDTYQLEIVINRCKAFPLGQRLNAGRCYETAAEVQPGIDAANDMLKRRRALADENAGA